MMLCFPPHLSSASALPCETENHKLRFFHLITALCQRTHKTHLNYYLVAAEWPVIPKVIDCMHQATTKTYLKREHSILLSVPRTLYVYQVCHDVGRCVKDESCSSSSLEWKLMDCISGISYCLNKCQTLKHITDMFHDITDDIFSFRNTVHRCTCIVRATQSNCCGALDFLSPEPCPLRTELNALTTRFMEPYVSVSMSRE